MATANKTLETRIQLKSDTEANWIAHPLVPLAGELIIYTADASHPYTRLKIGDGSTSTSNLPFIDSGTINGKEVELVKAADSTIFPLSGSPDNLYVDLSTNAIYHYTGASGYTKLSNFTYNISKTNVSEITRWRAGSMTSATVTNNILIIDNGLAPELLYEPKSVVQNVTKEGTE